MNSEPPIRRKITNTVKANAIVFQNGVDLRNICRKNHICTTAWQIAANAIMTVVSGGGKSLSATAPNAASVSNIANK